MGNARDLFDTKYFTRIYMTQVNPRKWSRLRLCLSGHFSPQNAFSPCDDVRPVGTRFCFPLFKST